MKRRIFVAAGAATLALPAIARAKTATTLTFIPYADLALLDPIVSAFVTRNHVMMVYETLFALDEAGVAQPQMLEGFSVDTDGKIWTLTLRDGLLFHDGTKVLARDAVASVQRWGTTDAFGQALLDATDELSAPSDTVIKFRLKRRFDLLPQALAHPTNIMAVIMPERLARTPPNVRLTEIVGSGPFRYLADERVPGAHNGYARFEKYVPRPQGVASFCAGPRIAHFDHIDWTTTPDPATQVAALQAGEVDWVEQPLMDLVGQLRSNRAIKVEVAETKGLIGFLRFNQLFPPFDNPAIRRVVVAAMDQKEVMEAVAGAEPSLYKTDVGLFVPGTPMASTVGVEVTRGPKDYEKLKHDLFAAGYNGERIVVLAATTIPTIWAMAQVGTDALTKIGFNVDLQALEWGSVVQRRASREPIDKGGWNIFYTWLGGFGNITPAPSIALRGNGTAAWFGWAKNPKIEELYSAWFEAPDQAAQQKICEAMQVAFWENPTFVPMGMYDPPTAFHNYMRDVPDGPPQFYSLKKAV